MTDIIENEVTLKTLLGLLIAIFSMCVMWLIVHTCYDIATSRDENRRIRKPYRTVDSRIKSQGHDSGLLINSEARDNNKFSIVKINPMLI